MSVKIANISGEKWYIGGAPRSKYFGQVLMFRQVNAYLRIERRHILVGGQFGEGFGHDLAVSDFNGDGWVLSTVVVRCFINISFDIVVICHSHGMIVVNTSTWQAWDSRFYTQPVHHRNCLRWSCPSSVCPHNPATGFWPPSATVVSTEPFLQKEMATYRHWSVSLQRDPDDVRHCRILSSDKAEWQLIPAALCRWRRCFLADQLWFMTHIREEEEDCFKQVVHIPLPSICEEIQSFIIVNYYIMKIYIPCNTWRIVICFRDVFLLQEGGSCRLCTVLSWTWYQWRHLCLLQQRSGLYRYLITCD